MDQYTLNMGDGTNPNDAGPPPANYAQPPTGNPNMAGQQPPPMQPMQPQQGYGNFGAQAMAASFLTGGDAGSAVGMAAAQYGEQQFSEISGKVSQYVDVGQMRFYFTVDTKYVGKKIQRLLLPFLPKVSYRCMHPRAALWYCAAQSWRS
eukprot:m.733981 g.733981  ORF g.733981 m.733981 type:complete len:149 (+) comp23077_c0_seq3:132-578(+)